MATKQDTLCTCKVTFLKNGLINVEWPDGVKGLSVKQLQKGWQLMYKGYRYEAKNAILEQRAKERKAAAEAARKQRLKEEEEAQKAKEAQELADAEALIKAQKVKEKADAKVEKEPEAKSKAKTESKSKE